MNYFSHGIRFIHDPYFLAGTAVPDWLSMADRKVRVRAKHAHSWNPTPDPRQTSLVLGIAQHHADDDWFHQCLAFVELSLQFSVSLRELLPENEGHRRGFLGHILVELLLDSVLIEEQPELLDAYYSALSSVDPSLVEQTVNLLAPRPTDRLQPLLPKFIQSRFLFDYPDDLRLTYRLNQVMQRVQLPTLPENFPSFLPQARAKVRERRQELLPKE